MKNSTLKFMQITLLCMTVLFFAACKKDGPTENHETYYKGTVGNKTIDFKSSFFYTEDGYTVYEGIGKVGDDNTGISLICTEPLIGQNGNEFPYTYDVDSHTERVDGAAILGLVFTNNPIASGLSYYEDCNGNTTNSPGTITIGKVEKVGNKAYVTGSFTGKVYTKVANTGCNYTVQDISIKFRVLNRKDLGNTGG